METETTDNYLASNGDCSPRKKNMLLDLSVNTPNGQYPDHPNSPASQYIKVEEEQPGEEEEDEERRDFGPEDMRQSEEEGLEGQTIDSPNNPKEAGPAPDGPNDMGFRLPNGDRPFQCGQCGVSFTQKGNLLRHIKLHTGEKPFKCPFCSYACRRRDALTGHLRTHSVGKPYKCNFCGRSYKQRASLEEHKERCHNYLQSVNSNILKTESYPVNARKEQAAILEAVPVIPFDQPPVIERLQSTLGKRKSTVPQKFVDEKMARFSYPEMSYEAGLKYEKEAEIIQAHMMDQAINNAISYLGTNSLRPLIHHPALSMADMMPIVNPLYTQVYPLGPRLERPSGQNILPPPPPPLDSPLSTHCPLALTRPKNSLTNQEETASNSGLESVGSERSSPQDRPINASNHVAHVKSSPTAGKEDVQELGPGYIEASYDRCVARSAYRVFGREGQEMRAFKCEHCRVLFLDHVMYTIHMGCHGYRNPLECNICGRRSQDRYEFSSHIVRGEHTFR